MAEQITVYESQHTAQQIEDAMGAVLSIGANGNWWIGDADTGVYAGGVKVTGAKPGQTIVVNAVDSEGVPTSWKPFTIPDRMRKIIDYTTEEETLNSTIPNIAFTTDLNGKAISEKNLLIRITGKVINTTDNDSQLRLSVGQLQTWVMPYCKPLNSTISMLLVVSVDDKGVVYVQGPLSSSTITSTTIDSNTTALITEFNSFTVAGNNYYKTHLAAGACITVWGFD